MVFPEKLNKGDTVALVAPSFPIKEAERESCVRLLESMGYRVKLGEELEKGSNFHNYLAGEGCRRGADINRMFADPEVKGIFCVRGGYGSSHVMPYLNFDIIKENPKIFVGYSDITNLLSAITMFGDMVTFHGPMVVSNMIKPWDDYTRESFYAALNMEDRLEFKNPPQAGEFLEIRAGRAEGILAGGNITLIARAIGTFYQLDTRGKILFFEDIEENIPTLDMLLTQIRQAGLLDQANGILLGHFTDCHNNRYDASYEIDQFLQDWFGGLDIPVMSHIASGHDKPMGTLPMGAGCRMDTEKKQLIFYREMQSKTENNELHPQEESKW